MSDDAKILDQPVAPQAPIQPSSPIGIPNKEIGPILSVVPEIKHEGSETKHGIDQELAELGVKEVQDRPDLTQVPDVQHAGPSVPPPTGPSGLVQVPLTREEALADLKIKKPTDSGWGLAKLALKALDVLGLKGF